MVRSLKSGTKVTKSKKNIFFSLNLLSIPRDIPWHHWKNLLTSKRGRSGGSPPFYWRFLPNVGQKFQTRKKSSNYFLKTSLVHLGGSAVTIGKISWPQKEAILEAETFALNFDRFEWKLQGALEPSIFIQFASVIPFWKHLGVLVKLCKIWLTSEVIRGHQRPLKMKKMGLITFFDQVWQTPNFKLKPSEHYVGDPWKKISWMRPGRHFFWR